MLVRQQPNRQRSFLSVICRRWTKSGRWINAFVAALIVVSTVLSLSPAPVRADGIAYIDTDVLNLRDEPGTWGNIITQMWQGEAVDIYSGPTDDGWYEVGYYGEWGWAYGGYLSIDGESGWYSDADSGGGSSGGVGGFGVSAWVDTDLLNMRGSASMDADVLDLLTQGEEVVVTGFDENGFVPVNAHGETAWVWSGYLSYDGPVGSAGPERWIQVDRSDQTVTLFEGDEAVATYWASLGYDQSSDGFYSTAIGTYYVYSKYAPLSWTEWGKAYIAWWVAFDSERDNGFHSYSMDSNGNVLSNGDGPTGGCVATEPGAAEEIYNFAEVGTRVVVQQ
jgi:uncharacterized protein YgiM (DUF1202 family)